MLKHICIWGYGDNTIRTNIEEYNTYCMSFSVISYKPTDAGDEQLEWQKKGELILVTFGVHNCNCNSHHHPVYSSQPYLAQRQKPHSFHNR